jgi:membrane-bound lytic murein transglycosylase D
MISALLLRRLPLILLVAPLVLLAGCPGENPNASSPASSSKSTAPALAGASQNGAGKQSAAPSGADAAARAPQAAAAESLKIQQTINQAEASYNSGVQNYRANRLDAARQDFDYAVDLMLSSGIDLNGGNPAADEFERLVNAINSLELAALKQGNGFSPKIEDAPLESATNMTFPPNPELVARLRNELNIASDLPLVINDQVAGYIGVFSNSASFRNHMAASLRRAGKYRELMQKILAQQGVPQDLIYLAVAESGFQPQVVDTKSGAGGMWQFMPSNDYLKRNGYFDERFDPEKSTRAYAKYIKALYAQFGDWYLAMAAYDWGPGNIQKVVQRTGYADFWELYRRNAIPAETRAYVPQILAAVIMAKNPAQYGLDHVVPDAPVLYDTVTTDYAIDLPLVADVTGSTVPEIAALNPALLRLATPRDMSFDLHLPVGTKALYNARLKDIPEDRRTSWRFHVVKPNETLASIASSLHARSDDIAETNGITLTDPMAVGDELVIPVQTVAAAAAPQRYRVGRGDTLLTIADRFNVSVDELRRWNALSSASVRPGRVLYVQEPVRRSQSMRGSSRRSGRGRERTSPASGRTAHALGKAGSRKPRHGAAHASHAAGSSKHAAGAASHGTSHSGKRKAAR